MTQFVVADPAPDARAVPAPATTLSLIVGDRDYTELVHDLSWSTVDPGGCETCSFTVPDRSLLPTVGTKVTVFVGLECVWEGRVDEPGQSYQGDRTSGQVTCVGAGAALKDDDSVQVIYIDRSLERWSAATRTYKINQNKPVGDPVVDVDSSGSPVLKLAITGPWSGWLPLAAMFYESEGVAVGSMNFVQSGHTMGVTDGFWGLEYGFISSRDLNGTKVGANYLSPLDEAHTMPATNPSPSACPFPYIYITYETQPAGTDGYEYRIFFNQVYVAGDHGLTLRGSGVTAGYYPAEIADHARGLGSGVDRGPIDTDANAFVCPHAVYIDPTTREQIIDDMMRLLGWHWGVWPAPGLGGGVTNPQLHLRKPPEDATAWVSRSDCEDVDLSERLTDMHNRAVVSYLEAGVRKTVTVTRFNPRIPSDLTRTLSLNLGIGGSSEAETYGRVILALEEQQARAAGRVVLPSLVATPAGMKHAALLRAGLDRLRINDLPNAGPLTEVDTRRFDTFRIRRTETRVSPSGALSTSVELDAGANLVEVLQARMANRLFVAGVG